MQDEDDEPPEEGEPLSKIQLAARVPPTSETGEAACEAEEFAAGDPDLASRVIEAAGTCSRVQLWLLDIFCLGLSIAPLWRARKPLTRPQDSLRKVLGKERIAEHAIHALLSQLADPAALRAVLANLRHNPQLRAAVLAGDVTLPLRFGD